MIIWTGLAIGLALLSTSSDIGRELIVNGGFEEADPTGSRPLGWSWPAENAEWISENGNRYIRLRDNASVGQAIDLKPDWWRIE
ncbi:hypothetical protein DRP77_06805, partial [Candidatus Poribacteria bacterium]